MSITTEIIQETLEPIYELLTGVTLGKGVVKNILEHHLEKNKIRFESTEAVVENITTEEQRTVLFYHIFEDKDHYYDLWLEFTTPRPETLVLTDYEFDEELETVEDEE